MRPSSFDGKDACIGGTYSRFFFVAMAYIRSVSYTRCTFVRDTCTSRSIYTSNSSSAGSFTGGAYVQGAVIESTDTKDGYTRGICFGNACTEAASTGDACIKGTFARGACGRGAFIGDTSARQTGINASAIEHSGIHSQSFEILNVGVGLKI